MNTISFRFFILTIAFWLISLIPASNNFITTLLSSNASIVIGILLAVFFMLFVKKNIYKIFILIFVVFLEQIFIVGSSFIDEVLLVAFFIQSIKFSYIKPYSIVFTGIILFIVWCFLSALYNGVNMTVYIAALRSYMQYALFFLLLYNLETDFDEIKELLKFMVMCAGIFSITSIIKLLQGSISLKGRAEAFLSNPNALAGYMLFVIPIIWLTYSKHSDFNIFEKKKHKWILWTSMIAILASGSRSMTIGLLIGIFIVFFLNRGVNFSFKIKSIIVVSILSAAAIYFTQGQILERFNLLTEDYYMTPRHNFRIYYSIEGIRLFNENKLFGVGPGLYGGSVSTIYDSPVYAKYGIISPKKWTGLAQSDIFYQHLLAEVGLIGSIIFLFTVFFPPFLWFAMLLFGKIYWSPIGAGCTASMIGLGVATFGGPYFELHITAIFYWLFIYIIFYEINRNKKTTFYLEE